ncbi:type I-E CRISPR-associated protein Cse1/CasA [Streptomyces caniferus]|uniref:type I-E CRISPR-associated protein Cse1/CasA n=1 Tax=Streptomyces caniferus TaxID=285557 RepID=UPI00381D1369
MTGSSGLDKVYGASPPWLPAGLAGGYSQALVAAHLIDHIDLPYEAAESVVLRNLIAMAMRLTGLDASRGSDWKRLRARVLEQGRFDETKVAAYFAEHRARMFLSDPVRPYRQVAALRGQCGEWSPPGKLVYGLPSGNNHVWFDKRDEDAPVPVHVAIWSLEALHGVGAGGGCGRRQLPGRTAWSKTPSGPYRNTVSYFVRGRNLFETLVLNCPSGPPAEAEDVAPWETDAAPDPLNPASAAVTGRVSLLTGRSPHAALLDVASDGRSVQGVQLTWAFEGPGVTMPPALDPYVIHEHKTDSAGNERITPVKAEPSRALWRDVDALLAHTRPAPAPRSADLDTTSRKRKGQQPPAPPQVFADLSSGLGSRSTAAVLRAARVRALSLASKQASDVLWWSADSPYALFRAEGDNTLVLPTAKAAHSEAEDTGGLLEQAAKAMATDMCAGNRKKAAQSHWPVNALKLYWDQAEPVFWHAIYEALEGRAYTSGRFLPAALAAYDEATAAAAMSPRGMQAVAKARTILTRRKKQPAERKDDTR